MKRLVMFCTFMLVIFSMFFVSSESSSNELQVKILGCSDGVNFASPGQCLGSTGYCADHDVVLDVFSEPNSCSGGRTPQQGNLKNYQVCCPSKTHECVTNGTGYGAGADPEDAYFCIAAVKDCSDYTQAECENDHFGQCYWYDPDGGGSEPGNCTPRSNTCYEYPDQPTCDADPLNLSLQDPNCRYGSSLSGGIEYIIPRESCNCYWDDKGTPADTSDDACGLNYSIVPGIGNDPSSFSTCKFTLSSGQCLDGFQDYLYTASFDVNTLSILPGDARCVDRTGKRKCGEAIVKVPFFDARNVIAIVLLVLLFYVLKTKFSGPKKGKRGKKK